MAEATKDSLLPAARGVLRVDGRIDRIDAAVAADYASRGVRCIAVCPGTIETEGVKLINVAGAGPVTTREHLAARQLDDRTSTAD